MRLVHASSIVSLPCRTALQFNSARNTFCASRCVLRDSSSSSGAHVKRLGPLASPEERKEKKMGYREAEFGNLDSDSANAPTLLYAMGPGRYQVSLGSAIRTSTPLSDSTC